MYGLACIVFVGHYRPIGITVRSALVQFSNFKNFLWVCWFLGKKLSNFIYPVWKLHNPYCHNVLICRCACYHSNSTKGGQKGRFFFIHIKRAIFKQGKGVENLVHMKYFLIKFGYDNFVRDNRIGFAFKSLGLLK